MKPLTLLLIAALLLALIAGCTHTTIPETAPLEGDLRVPENDLALPDETLTGELASSEEPSFSSVI